MLRNFTFSFTKFSLTAFKNLDHKSSLRLRFNIAWSSHPEVFYKKGVPRNFVKFPGNFPVNFAKFLRTPFIIEHLR